MADAVQSYDQRVPVDGAERWREPQEARGRVHHIRGLSV